MPSDADLWPGELPFTAWGQWDHGALDLRVFEQDIWWVDAGQEPHRLTEMSEEYLTNVVTFLTAGVEYFYQAQGKRLLLEILTDALVGRDNAELVALAAGAPALSDITPASWLAGTPLMRALHRELERRWS